MASRNIVVKNNTRCFKSALQQSSDFSFLVLYILADLISFLEMQRLKLARSSSTVFAVNLVPTDDSASSNKGSTIVLYNVTQADFGRTERAQLRDANLEKTLNQVFHQPKLLTEYQGGPTKRFPAERGLGQKMSRNTLGKAGQFPLLCHELFLSRFLIPN